MSERDIRPLPPIERMQPDDALAGMRRQQLLDTVGTQVAEQQKLIPLATYMREIARKPRGTETGGKQDLNSHTEEFIIKDGNGIRVLNLADLQSQLATFGVDTELLGVQSIGNKNQKVTAMVQGYNPDNPNSGYERPVVAEGPHMILAPYAFDSEGKLHVFRTVQFRTGDAVIDTPRGFAAQKELENGQVMYDIENAGESVHSNMKRILKDEQGDKFLQIKRIKFLGAPRVNTTFVDSQSAIFGVEVDYDSFKANAKVATPQEYERQREQFEHEGLTNIVLDMTYDEYVDYKRDSRLMKDMAADSPSDIVVMDYMYKRMDQLHGRVTKREKQVEKELRILRRLKETNPEAWNAYHNAVAEQKALEEAESASK